MTLLSFLQRRHDYRKRSHFDGQNLLENGASVPFGAKDGWLNRALAQLYDEDSRMGLALGPTVPLILQVNARSQDMAAKSASKT